MPVPAVAQDLTLRGEHAAALDAANVFLSLVDRRDEAKAWPLSSEVCEYGALSAMRRDLDKHKSRTLQKLGFTDGLGDA